MKQSVPTRAHGHARMPSDPMPAAPGGDAVAGLVGKESPLRLDDYKLIAAETGEVANSKGVKSPSAGAAGSGTSTEGSDGRKRGLEGAAASGALSSGVSADTRWAPEVTQQVQAPTVGANNNARSGGSFGTSRSFSGAPNADPKGASQASTGAGASDAEVPNRAPIAPASVTSRPRGGRWAGMAAPAPAGGRAGGSRVPMTRTSLASSGSWAEAPDDVALTKKFRVSLMFYTKVSCSFSPVPFSLIIRFPFFLLEFDAAADVG